MTYLTLIMINLRGQEIPGLWFILKILILPFYLRREHDQKFSSHKILFVRPLNFPFHIFLFQRFPLVIMMFSTCQGDRQFG
jgi:hypothetical protein